MNVSWFGRSNRAARFEAESAIADQGTLRKCALTLTDYRDRLVKKVRQVNDQTNAEVKEAAHFLNNVVETARGFVADSQRALSRMQGEGEDSVGQLLSKQSQFLHDYAADMTERAAAQDERARQAAAAAKSIADLAASIERLAGEARLLAVNARIESSRLGAHSAGFEVLASEMQRLSDEVASTNERVGELAARLGQDLPWIAQHARDLRRAMEEFTTTSTMQLDETEKSVTDLRAQATRASRAGGAVLEDILRSSQAALSHLQFQDVVSQELRLLDGQARAAQLEVLQALNADPAVVSEIPDAEYRTLGGDGPTPEGANTSAAGDVMLF